MADNLKLQANSMRVAVFSPNKDKHSETFIRAHIEKLPMQTLPIYGDGWQRFDKNGYLWPIGRYPGRVLARAAPRMNRRLYALALAWKLKRMRVHVVLAEYGTTGASIMDACRLARAPLVVYFFGFDAYRHAEIKENMEAYRRMFTYASAVLAVSEPMRQQLIGWGAPESRTHLNVCGVDPSKFDAASPAKAPPNYVSVGRFVEKKAPFLTVLAFCDVVKAEPSAKLFMVGDGPLLGPTRRLIHALKLENNVELLGRQSPETVSGLLRNARAFVQHSLVADDGDSEGTPVSIIEAQMAGVPVVSTRHAGIPNVVREVETGFLVDEGDAIEMGKTMTALAQDPVLAGRMGQQARLHAMAKFSMDTHLSALAKTLATAALANLKHD